MENGIIQVHLIDGGIFRVIFENKNQKISEWGLLTNGIHSTKDFETIIKNR